MITKMQSSAFTATLSLSLFFSLSLSLSFSLSLSHTHTHTHTHTLTHTHTHTHFYPVTRDGAVIHHLLVVHPHPLHLQHMAARKGVCCDFARELKEIRR